MPAAARDELKRWLAITSSNEDALMDTLLRAAIEMCEAFTGIMVLEQTCREFIPATGNWQTLGVRPVRSLELLAAFPAAGSGYVLGSSDYELDIDADQIGRIRLHKPADIRRLQVEYEAGMTDQWDQIPDGLRQGIIRLAAYHYRERDGASASPPAAVAALWRPWRRLRLT